MYAPQVNDSDCGGAYDRADRMATSASDKERERGGDGVKYLPDRYMRVRLECANCGKLLAIAAKDFQGPIFIKCRCCGHEIMFQRCGEAAVLKTW